MASENDIIYQLNVNGTTYDISSNPIMNMLLTGEIDVSLLDSDGDTLTDSDGNTLLGDLHIQFM